MKKHKAFITLLILFLSILGTWAFYDFVLEFTTQIFNKYYPGINPLWITGTIIVLSFAVLLAIFGGKVYKAIKEVVS